MRHAILAGIFALSSSRAGCGVLSNSLSIEAQRQQLAEERARVDALSRELAQTRHELAVTRAAVAAHRVWIDKHGAWSTDRIRELTDQIRRLEEELEALKRQPER